MPVRLNQPLQQRNLADDLRPALRVCHPPMAVPFAYLGHRRDDVHSVPQRGLDAFKMIMLGHRPEMGKLMVENMQQGK